MDITINNSELIILCLWSCKFSQADFGMVYFGLRQSHPIIVTIENWIEHLHEGVAQNEKVLLTFLEDVQSRDWCHAVLIAFLIHILVDIHEVMGRYIIVDTINDEGKRAKFVFIFAIFFLRQNFFEHRERPGRCSKKWSARVWCHHATSCSISANI